MREAGRAKRLLVVIVNYKTAELTTACLRSLRPEATTLAGCHIVVVDNASGDGPALRDIVRTEGWEDWVTIDVAKNNGGFAAGNNVAIHPALANEPPEFVLLLNSDTEARTGALRILVEFMEAHPDVGIAGSGIENPDGSDWPIAFRFITPAGQLLSALRLGFLDRLFPSTVVPRRMDQTQAAPVDWVAGASMIVRREVFETIGLLDEGYFLYFEEVDFCLRARRAGWPCWYVPQSRIMHIGGQSSGVVGVGGKSREKDSNVPRIPAYWFESRRRYFLKNFGCFGAIVADIGFSIGYTFWRLRRRLQRKPDLDPPFMLSDIWRHSPLRRGIGPRAAR